MIEPDPLLPPIEQEERRRVFWSFYVIDKLIACGRERPPAILDEECKLQLPCNESAFIEGRHQQSLTLEQLASESSSPPSLSPASTFALLVLMSSTFGKVVQYTLSEHKYLKQGLPWDPKSQFSNICFTLLQMESIYGLGEPLIGRIQKEFVVDGKHHEHKAAPLVYAHALFHTCHCLLHHPFLLRQRLARLETRAPLSFLTRALDTCRSHAMSLTTLIKDVKAIGFTTTAPFYAYFNFLTGTIHALFLHSNDDPTRIAAEGAFASCLQNLRELSVAWPHAGQMVSWMSIGGSHSSWQANHDTIQIQTLEQFKENSERVSSLLRPSPQVEQLSVSDIAMLWESVDSGSLLTARQSNSLPQESLPPYFGSPFLAELFDFSSLDNLPPSALFSPLHSYPSPAAPSLYALKYNSYSTSSTQESDALIDSHTDSSGISRRQI